MKKLAAISFGIILVLNFIPISFGDPIEPSQDPYFTSEDMELAARKVPYANILNGHIHEFQLSIFSIEFLLIISIIGISTFIFEIKILKKFRKN